MAAPETGLFKYLDESKLIFFEKSLVLLTPPVYLNDPWDFRPKGRVPTEDEIRNLWQEVETEITRTSVISLPAEFVHRERQERLEKIRADVSGDDFLCGQGENYQNEIGKIVGIVSLTELPLSRAMWAHYGGSHTGFVIELAAGEESDWNSFVIRGMGSGLVAAKVKYPASFWQAPISQDADNIADVCFSKHPQWEYEREWRILAPLRGAIHCRLVSNTGQQTSERFCVPFVPKNLRRVIFGMRMKTETKNRLSSMLARNGFKHVQQETTDIDPTTGELVLKPIKPNV